MIATYYTPTLASNYGSGTYDTNNYNGTNAVSGSTGSTGSAGGGLSNTGIAVAGIVTLAAVILLVALVVRIWKRPSKKAVAQENAED
jgi:hypothetical protein